MELFEIEDHAEKLPFWNSYRYSPVVGESQSSEKETASSVSFVVTLIFGAN